MQDGSFAFSESGYDADMHTATIWHAGSWQEMRHRNPDQGRLKGHDVHSVCARREHQEQRIPILSFET